MSFIDYQFLIFFPLVTLGFFMLAPRWRWSWLLVASCYFYMCFRPVYILILMLTIAVDYVAGLAIERTRGQARRGALVASLLANIGVLAFFKYFGFFSANWAPLAAWLGWPDIPALDIILPIGLSFHTFQSLAYTIEVYRGDQKAEPNLGRLATYVMFYPQLVAGPIERPQNLLRQLQSVQTFDAARAVDGLRLMLWGFVKKVVVADRLAEYVNAVYAQPEQFHGPQVLLATYFFAFQIYCDFSGYTDIARGAARVMGFNLMLNFRRPYFAQSISEFWKRWHISLSTWFRDYLYIPLGGNRVAPVRRYVNLLVVFLVSGLWHGANWTYVVWGGLHGVYLASGLLTAPLRRRALAALRWSQDSRPLRWGRILLNFHLVLIAWVFFRAPSMDQAWAMFRRMADISSCTLRLPNQSGADFGITLGALAVLGIIEACWERWPLPTLFRQAPAWVRWAAYVGAALAILNLGVTQEVPFIYFQF
jgi:D-alanyl-lipoteichoic acid acyltransferase DltB (MBOAT superfamily)